VKKPTTLHPRLTTIHYIDFTATIRTPGKKPLRIACPLYEALKFGHGPHPKPEIRKAIRKIGQTRTT
jgi:hypothetical protein